jgi:hypothetical protein
MTLKVGKALILPCSSIDASHTVEANSLERIDQYINNEQEPKPTEGGVPPAYWPSSGTLRVENLSARYSQVRLMLQKCG